MSIASAQAPLVSIQEIGKRFQSQDGTVVTALDRIAFDVADGEFIAVVGPSGCGKSTLLHILAGVLTASSGVAQLRGRPITGPRRDVGVVFQEALLLPWRTVFQNILLPVEVHKLAIELHRERAEQLLALTHLDEFHHKYPHELSGGMQQRVSIARALIHDPAILLMDEPFGALDAMTREQLNLDLLDIWTKSNKTILLITHSIQEAVFMADRVVVMSPRPGRIAEIMDIDLPRPRDLDLLAAPEFGAFTRHIRNLLSIRGLD